MHTSSKLNHISGTSVQILFVNAAASVALHHGVDESLAITCQKLVIQSACCCTSFMMTSAEYAAGIFCKADFHKIRRSCKILKSKA